MKVEHLFRGPMAGTKRHCWQRAAVLALIFYPSMQGDYEMRCEGSAMWNNQTAWVVHSSQMKGKRPRTVTMETTSGLHPRGSTAREIRPLRLEGRAWLAADSGQVMHLETNLVESIPMIELGENAFSVDYAPVRFNRRMLKFGCRSSPSGTLTTPSAV
jgi:hypothetical protein